MCVVNIHDSHGLCVANEQMDSTGMPRPNTRSQVYLHALHKGPVFLEEEFKHLQSCFQQTLTLLVGAWTERESEDPK